MSKYMMATKAMHKLGDISRDEPDLCVITREDKDNYIGMWVFGLGFAKVKFPKETTKELTPEQVEEYNNMETGMYSLITGERSYSMGTLKL